MKSRIISDVAQKGNLTSHFSLSSQSKIMKDSNVNSIRGQQGYKSRTSSSTNRNRSRKKSKSSAETNEFTGAATAINNNTSRINLNTSKTIGKSESSEFVGAAAMINNKPTAGANILSDDFTFRNNTSRIRSGSSNIMSKSMNMILSKAEIALSKAESESDDVSRQAIFAAGKARAQGKLLASRSLTTTKNAVIVTKNVVEDAKTIKSKVKDYRAASFLKKNSGKAVQESEDFLIAKNNLKGLLSNNITRNTSANLGISSSIKGMIVNFNAGNNDDVGVQAVVKTKDTVMKSSSAIKASVNFPKKSVKAIKNARDKIYKTVNKIKAAVRMTAKVFSNPVMLKILGILAAAALGFILIAGIISAVANIFSNLNFLSNKNMTEEETYSDYLEVIDTEYIEVTEFIKTYAEDNYDLELGDDYEPFNIDLTNEILAAFVVEKKKENEAAGIADEDVELSNSDVSKYLISMIEIRRTVILLDEDREEVDRYISAVNLTDLLNEIDFEPYDSSGYDVQIQYRVNILSIDELMEYFEFTEEENDSEQFINDYFTEEFSDLFEEFKNSKENENNG